MGRPRSDARLVLIGGGWAFGLLVLAAVVGIVLHAMP